MKRKLIGTIEYIFLPDVSEETLSAKIDTGADSSAVWASNIQERDGELEYTLFAPGSSYYTGERNTTSVYKITSVKNSFGHQEMRYKVKLKIQIGDQSLKRWFSLADRSRNTYPVLLGKNILKNKFIVDVSETHLHTAANIKKVLVISSEPTKMNVFLKQVSKHNDNGVEYDSISWSDVLIDVNDSETQVLDMKNNIDIAAYDLVYIKSHWKHSEMASSLAEYMMYKSKRLIDQEIKEYTSHGKVSEYMKLACHAISVPRAFCGYPATLLKNEQLIQSELGFPFVLKAADADRGKDNFLVRDEATFIEILRETSHTRLYVAQKFIENDGFYRLNSFGKEVRLVVFRKAHSHVNPLKAHLNKPSGGANAEKIAISKMPNQAVQLAVRGAMCLSRQIAGVDMIKDKHTGKWYVLEVNSSPQLRSGSHLEEKMTEFARFIDLELRK